MRHYEKAPAAENPGWGNEAAAEATRKHAFKLIFNSTSAVKGIISRLQTESVLQEEVNRRRLEEQQAKAWALVEAVASAAADAATAAVDNEFFDHIKKSNSLETDSEVICLGLLQHPLRTLAWVPSIQPGQVRSSGAESSVGLLSSRGKLGTINDDGSGNHNRA